MEYRRGAQESKTKGLIKNILVLATVFGISLMASDPKKRWWERLLQSEGMPEELDDSGDQLGNGLGWKTEEEEVLEDNGGHSRMCPLNLHSTDIDQVNDRPVEDDVESGGWW